jgi:hypothetical protein
VPKHLCITTVSRSSRREETPSAMNVLKDYREYLLAKTPQAPAVQYFWLALSGGIIVYVIWNFTADSLLRSLLLLVISLSLVTDAVTNLAYFKNRPLFERMVNFKIGANIVSLIFIIVFLALSSKFKL